MAPAKPSACVPNPRIATIARNANAPTAPAATRARSRQRAGASTTNGSTRPADAFTPIAATIAIAAPRKRGAVPAASASAQASRSSTSVSLWAPPSASSSSTGFRPTNTAAVFAERPIFAAALAVRATAPRLVITAIAFSVQIPPATPSGAIA